MTDVRAKFAEVAKGLGRVHRIAAGQSMASVEVRTRLEMAAATAVLDHADAPLINFDKLDPLALMSYLADIADSAKRSLPREQRRTYASPLPIYWIDRALLRGFADHHAGHAPEYTIQPSVTKPPFPEIAAIVYEAIGAGKGEPPERALRAYIKLRKKSRYDHDRGTVEVLVCRVRKPE
jgi:hypothetical protein